MDTIEEILTIFKEEKYSSPYYFFNLKQIEINLQRIKKLSSKFNNVKILMAVKSFSNDQVFNLVSKYLHGFDVSNITEYELVQKYIAEKVVSICGPAAMNVDFVNIASASVLFDVSTYSQLYEVLEKNECMFGVRVRINDFENERIVRESHFGFTFDVIQKKIPLNRIRGFHFHRGFGNNDIDFYKKSVEEVLSFAEKNNILLSYINCGGGYKWENFPSILQEIVKIVPSNIDIYFEPGDLLFENCGYLVTKVLEVNSKSEQDFDVVVDASKDSHLKWSRPNYVYPQLGNEDIRLNIFGPTCYEGDYIGTFQVSLPPNYLLPGGCVVLSRVTGYSCSWNTSFNGIKEAGLKFY